MQAHVIAASRWVRRHRHEIAVATALVLTLVALLTTPILLVAAAVEWKHSKRRGRLLSLALLAALSRATVWLWREFRGLPHARWHPCAHCGHPIEEPSRAAYCSHACRTYARLERDALDTDPRIAKRAECRIQNLRLRELADAEPAWTEVPF